MKNSWLMFYIIAIGVAAILLGLSGFQFEGFQAGMPGKRCGVDMPSCREGTTCMNGFCQSPAVPTLPANTLSVYP
jgi:hypothetical protein